MKLYRGKCMSREDELLRALLEKKNWLCDTVNSNTYFRTAVPLQGYRFDFFDVQKKYLVNQSVRTIISKEDFTILYCCE